jgi:hypothetical protein
LKLNADGTVAWQKTYGGSDGDTARCIQQTSDGGYVVAGTTESFGAGYEDFWVLRLNATGEIPGCSAMGSSEATGSDTSAVVADTSVVAQDSSAVATDVLDTMQDAAAERSVVCSVVPTIEKVRPLRPYAGDIIRIIGYSFGDGSGNSQVHIGPKSHDIYSSRIKLWTDTKIKIKIPFGNKPCAWYKHGDGEYRKRKVWVTVGGVDSNIKRIKVLKPGSCP